MGNKIKLTTKLIASFKKTMDDRNSLIFKWVSFFKVFLSPIVLSSLLAAIFLIVFSIVNKNNLGLSAFSGLVGSFLAAVFGAFFKEGYTKLTEESILQKKGESALRNIRSIEGQIIRIRALAEFFCSKKYKKKLSPLELKEINRHLETMSISVASGIEDWTDIVPALKEKKAKDRELIKTITPLLEELTKNQIELMRAKDTDTKKELEKKIEELKDKIDNQGITKRGLILSEPTRQTFSAISSGSGVLNSGFLDPSILGLSQYCRLCGKELNYQNIGTSSFFHSGLCDDCNNLPTITLSDS